jgi:hypothetical protein
VSSNGWIGFSPGQTSGYVAQFIPNGGAPKNAILADWEDLFPSTGQMNYYVTGTAPERKMVFNFNGVGFYGCRSTLVTWQIVLYETTNVIDINVLSKPQCGGYAATMGLTDQNGTRVVPVGGKNAVQWSVSTPESYRFTPSVVSSNFELNRTVFTNSQGQYQFTSTGLDINNFEFRVNVNAPTPTQLFTDNDGKKVSDFILGRSPINGLTYHRFDLNNDGSITVSDQFLLFGMRSGLVTNWVIPRSSYFNPSDFVSISNSNSNVWSLYSGSTSIMTGNLSRGGTQNFYLIISGYSGKVTF